MNSKPIPQRISAFLLCFALLVGLLPTSALAADTPHDISQGTLTISQNGSYTVTGTTSSNRIIVNSGVTATITLAGVSITAPEGEPAIDVQGTANLTIILQDSSGNTLVGGTGTGSHGAPGIHVPSSATLTIQGGGTLNVTGGSSEANIGGVGIGGNSTSVGVSSSGEACGTVIILGGTVIITGGSTQAGSFDGVGIGGGSQSGGGTGGAGGTVIILGGDVTVKGGSGAADIGGGSGTSR